VQGFIHSESNEAVHYVDKSRLARKWLCGAQLKASDLKSDAFVILGSSSEFEAISLISEADNVLSIGTPNYVRSLIVTWNDDLGAFNKEWNWSEANACLPVRERLGATSGPRFLPCLPKAWFGLPPGYISCKFQRDGFHTAAIFFDFSQ
jgi:hypothetical protein